MDIKKWLTEEPAHDELNVNPDNSYFIPIGVVEQLLDTFDNWSTEGFEYTITRTSDRWIINASCLLVIEYDQKERTMNGAVSFEIGVGDVNDNYAATALSYCISNAAKRLGNRFGRSLNNRLHIGETAEQPDHIKQKMKPDVVIKKQYENAKKNGAEKMVADLEDKYDFSNS